MKAALVRTEKEMLAFKYIYTLVPPEQVKFLDGSHRKGSGAISEAYNYRMGNLARKISAKVPEEDAQAYIRSLLNTEHLLSKDPNMVEEAKLTTLCAACDSLREMALFEEEARKWQNTFSTQLQSGNFEAIEGYWDVVRNLNKINERYNDGVDEPKADTVEDPKLKAYFAVASEVFLFKLGEHANLATAAIGDRMLSIIYHGMDKRNPDITRSLLKLYKEVPFVHEKIQEQFLVLGGIYARRHALNETAVNGFLNKMLPALQKNDPQIAALRREGNLFAMNYGEFGLGDFLLHCYALKVTPQHINELVMALKHFPGNTLSKLNQNRLDALNLDPHLRTIVHDERQYAHDLISAMLAYYKNRDVEKLEAAFAKAQAYDGKSYANDREELLKRARNISFYDESVTIHDLRNKTRPGKAKEVLERLKMNTSASVYEPSYTKFNSLNDAIKSLVENASSRSALKDVLDEMNRILKEMIKNEEVAIDPNMVLAIAWIERKAYSALHNMSYEEQQFAFKEPWFSSLLEFQELTASAANFDESSFAKFLHDVKNSASCDDAYHLISNHALKNVASLENVYGSKKKELRFDMGCLWSGNVAHELISMGEAKPAQTVMGYMRRNLELSLRNR